MDNLVNDRLIQTNMMPFQITSSGLFLLLYIA